MTKSGADNWHEIAMEVYRLARLQLQALTERQLQEHWMQVEEIREALLDLKQATIENDARRMAIHVDEVGVLLHELRLRIRGDSDA